MIGMLQSWTKVEVKRAGMALWEGGRVGGREGMKARNVG